MSVILYVVVMWKTARGPKADPADVPEIPVAESIRPAQLTPAWLDNWKPWLIGMAVLLVIAYGPQLWNQISEMQLTSP